MALAPTPLTDWHFVEMAREEASCVAAWALSEEHQTPSWRILRRRYLARVFEQKCVERDELTAELEKAERREAWEKPEPPSVSR